jgi:hypothetical protein
MNLQRGCAVLAMTAMWLVAGPLRAAGEREDLQPKPARWTDLPGDVRFVVVDHGGRAWFQIQGEATREEIKTQVERAVTMKAPWVRGANLLLVDAQGRVWLSPLAGHCALWCYDPAKKSWTERPPWQDPKAPPNPNDLYPHAASTECYQSRKGVVYFGGRRGVYTMAGDTWSYQPFYQANVATNRYYGDIKTFNPVQFAEAEDGTVYAWSPWSDSGWTGTLGCWAHDGKAWNQVLMEIGDEKQRGRIRSISPLRGTRLLVCPEGEACPFILQMTAPETVNQQEISADIPRLADERFAVREAAQARLAAWGTGALPALRAAIQAAGDAEIRTRLTQIVRQLEHPETVGKLDGRPLSHCDSRGGLAQGNVFLWANRLGTPRRDLEAFWVSPEGQLTAASAELAYPDPMTLALTGDRKLVVGMRGQGVGLLSDGARSPQWLTDPTEAGFWNIFAVDGAGRLFVTDQPPQGLGPRWVGAHVAVLDPRQKETRLSLPATAYPLDNTDIAIALDTTGRVWTKLAGKDQPSLSVFEDGAWKDAQLPQGSEPAVVQGIQALAEGGLVVRSRDGRAFLLEGGKWSVGASLAALVEKHFERLKEVVVDRAGMTRNVLLRRDAARNLWLVDWNDARAYTGQQWVHMETTPDGAPVKKVRQIVPAESGRRMLVIGYDDDMALAEIRAGRMRLERFDKQMYDADAAGSNLDGLYVDSRGRSWLTLNGSGELCLDDAGRHQIPALRNARGEDSAGRIWFLDSWEKTITIAPPSGPRRAFPIDGLYPDSSIAEDKPASLWLTTAAGLAHFTVNTASATLDLQRVADYTRGLPRNSAHGLWPDGRGYLWTIEIPPNSPAQPALWRIQIK